LGILPLASRSAAAFCCSDNGSGVETPICAKQAMWTNRANTATSSWQQYFVVTVLRVIWRGRELIRIPLIRANFIGLYQQILISGAKLVFQIFELHIKIDLALCVVQSTLFLV